MRFLTTYLTSVFCAEGTKEMDARHTAGSGVHWQNSEGDLKKKKTLSKAVGVAHPPRPQRVDFQNLFEGINDKKGKCVKVPYIRFDIHHSTISEGT